MTRMNSAPVTTQPIIPDIYNTFGIMGNEKILYDGNKERRRCGCTDVYYTTLTDARILTRTERQICWCCSSQGNYSDVSIFLRDIGQIREKHIRCCCCRSEEILELRGVFGSKILHLSEDDFVNLQYEIPIRTANHKLISHH